MATLGSRELKKGLKGATKDTGDLVAASADDTGKAVGGSMTSSVSDLKGDERVQAWDEGISIRHQTAMQQAQEALVKMPYPPVTD